MTRFPAVETPPLLGTTLLFLLSEPSAAHLHGFLTSNVRRRSVPISLRLIMGRPGDGGNVLGVFWRLRMSSMESLELLESVIHPDSKGDEGVKVRWKIQGQQSLLDGSSQSFQENIIESRGVPTVLHRQGPEANGVVTNRFLPLFQPTQLPCLFSICRNGIESITETLLKFLDGTADPGSPIPLCRGPCLRPSRQV